MSTLALKPFEQAYPVVYQQGPTTGVEDQNFGQATLDILHPKYIGTLGKTVKVVTDWMTYVWIDARSELKTAGNIGNNTKNFADVVVLPSTVYNFGKSVVDFFQKPSWTSIEHIFDWGTVGVAKTYNATELVVVAILKMPKQVITKFEGANGFALILSKLKESIISVINLAKKGKNSAQIRQGIITLIKAINFIALGVLIVLSCFFSVLFHPLVFLSVVTGTVALTILSMYHERMNAKALAFKKA